MTTPDGSKRSSPPVLQLSLKFNLQRRPLWQPETVMDCLDLSQFQLMEQIENGGLTYAFNVSPKSSRKEPRILALSVVEKQLGPLPEIGSTQNLKLEEVIDFILPARDLRSTEIKHLFACGPDWMQKMKSEFAITLPSQRRTGPTSYFVCSRASVAQWLRQRRIS